MRLAGPPRPWFTVPVGAVVLLGADPVPRAVLANDPIYPGRPGDSRVVLIEGVYMPPAVGGLSFVQVVELDEIDAMLNLFGAGFEPVVINVKES